MFNYKYLWHLCYFTCLHHLAEKECENKPKTSWPCPAACVFGKSITKWPASLSTSTYPCVSGFQGVLQIVPLCLLCSYLCLTCQIYHTASVLAHLREEVTVEEKTLRFCLHWFINKASLLILHVCLQVGSEVSFTGLGKEELMQYANDPFWVRLRIILFAAFWIGWVAMLVAAIVIIVLAPRCPERPDMKWFQKDAIYQIFPKSFQDTTEDKMDEGAGIGDLKG